MSKYTVEQESKAIERIREYETVIGDAWRNDFEEDGYAADDLRRNIMIQEVAAILLCSETDAEEFYDQKRYR